MIHQMCACQRGPFQTLPSHQHAQVTSIWKTRFFALSPFHPFLQEQVAPLKARLIVTNGMCLFKNMRFIVAPNIIHVG